MYSQNTGREVKRTKKGATVQRKSLGSPGGIEKTGGGGDLTRGLNYAQNRALGGEKISNVL
jgi:hypothetical protein